MVIQDHKAFFSSDIADEQHKKSPEPHS